MLASTQGRGQALCWEGQLRASCPKKLCYMQSAPLQDIHEVGIKGTPAESSSMARGTQGWKQSSMGMFQPPSQSSASHQHDAQEREQGEQISTVRDLGMSALLYFTLERRKENEPWQVRGEPKKLHVNHCNSCGCSQGEDERGAGGWRRNWLCRRSWIKPERI